MGQMKTVVASTVSTSLELNKGAPEIFVIGMTNGHLQFGRIASIGFVHRYFLAISSV